MGCSFKETGKSISRGFANMNVALGVMRRTAGYGSITFNHVQLRAVVFLSNCLWDISASLQTLKDAFSPAQSTFTHYIIDNVHM